MAKVIAVAGKGGVGKTTIAGFIVRFLKEQNCAPILAVDADPSMNLNITLGVDVHRTIGEIREEARPEIGKRPAYMSLAEYFELEVNLALVESNSFDLLTIGRPEGKGCYCSANSNLRDMLKKITSNYKYVVIDNEAGMEHISRQTDDKVDVMLIISDSSPKGLIAAVRTNELIRKLENEVKHTFFIINREAKDLPSNFIKEIENHKLPFAGSIHFDPSLSEYEIVGKSIFDLPDDSILYRDIKDILQRINEVCHFW
ncbi:MAG: AAA family ATPase [bacterium]